MLSREMPSSSNSSGFSCRGVISSWLKASVATSAPFVPDARAYPPPRRRLRCRAQRSGGLPRPSLLWATMGPDGGGAPEGALADAIDDVFGSLDELKKAVNDGGVTRFGSGWSWLVHDGTGLAVYSLPNQDSPIIQSDEPLLGLGVWEHAYYLKYQNRRREYPEAWWNVANWP